MRPFWTFQLPLAAGRRHHPARQRCGKSGIAILHDGAVGLACQRVWVAFSAAAGSALPVRDPGALWVCDIENTCAIVLECVGSWLWQQ